MRKLKRQKISLVNCNVGNKKLHHNKDPFSSYQSNYEKFKKSSEYAKFITEIRGATLELQQHIPPG